jgi:predicted esterase
MSIFTVPGKVASGPRAATRGLTRWGLSLGAVAVMVIGLSGCLLPQIGPPTGAAPLRYRDTIFPAVTTTRDLQYGSAPDLSNHPVALTLDLYQPSGDPATARPAIVWVHGGGFVGGDKSTEGPIVTPMAQRGFVVVSIDYRLMAPDGCTGSDLTAECIVAAGDAINDAQAAVRWLRANAATYRIDPGRVAIAGFSAGAITATGVAVSADQPGTSGNPGYSSAVKAWMSVSGGLPGGELISASTPPGYLFSGTADTTVPYQWSVDTAHALDAAGGLAVLYTETGVGHSLPDLNLLDSQMANFLYLTMGLSHAAT